MTTAALATTNLEPDALPDGWSLEELWPCVMATVGQRDSLFKQNEASGPATAGGAKSPCALGWSEAVSAPAS